MGEITKAAASDAGCWIDGHWGIYGAVRLVAIATTHGRPMSDEDTKFVDAWHNAISSIDDVDVTDAVREIADEAETWMNENIAPDGYSFGWHDGEFFLQSSEWWSIDV